MVVQAGSRNEVEPGRSGFAHLFEHMMFRGTERFPSEKWEEIMQAAGAETNAYTTDDRTVYHAVFAKEDLERILELEADRFQNLEYSEEVFRTETRAVLSEYNKSFANPFRKLEEALRDTAFTTHTYKHTTMGFLEDVENMPEMYDYGLEFFDRYYRPEYTIVSIVGDIDFAESKALVEKYWGGWEKGSYEAPIPAEPPQNEPKTVTVDFHAPTLPILNVAFHAPAYDDEEIDSAVLDVISFHAFGDSSELYKQLVIEEQKVDMLSPAYYDHVDPYPFSIYARVKDEADVDYVERRILETCEALKNEPVPGGRARRGEVAPALSVRARDGLDGRDRRHAGALSGAAADARDDQQALRAVSSGDSRGYSERGNEVLQRTGPDDRSTGVRVGGGRTDCEHVQAL